MNSVTPRPYQHNAIEAVFEDWKDHTSTMIVLPTGTGKSVCFAEIIRRIQPKRALVIAHRAELVFQAAKHVERAGLPTSIEMAELSADTDIWGDDPIVVATVQTLISGSRSKRMQRFNPDDFGLLVVDECHHATAGSYRQIFDHFKQNPELKIFGCTATPDRADEEALGQVFESVAFDYEILDAINDGWLVPIEQQMVTIEGLDFSAIRTTAGDLNGADLALVMEAEKNLHGIVSASLEIIGDRRTLVFAVTVKQAEMYAEIFNRHRPGAADWICGKTPKDQRHEALRKFSNGDTQIMVNVGVFTEGYDNPGIEVIIQARPTKSRCLYSQMVGRATRPLPGVVDPFETAEERIEAIAMSSKPSMLAVDFVGNSGRHKLITTADILGGKVSDEAVEFAIKKAREKGTAVDISKLLAEEEAKLRKAEEERKRRDAARKANVVGKAIFSSRSINPFDVFQLEPLRERGWDKGKTLSEKQQSLLRKQGIDPRDISYAHGKQVIGELFNRWSRNLCSLKQANVLRRYGYETKEMTRTEASKLIDALVKNKWKRPVESNDHSVSI